MWGSGGALFHVLLGSSFILVGIFDHLVLVRALESVREGSDDSGV